MRLGEFRRGGIGPHDLAPDAFCLQALEAEAKQGCADFGAKAAAPHGGMDAPAQFNGAVALHDQEAIANRFAG